MVRRGIIRNVHRDIMPERRAQRLIRRQRAVVVIRLARRVLELPGDVALRLPLVRVRHVGVVGNRVHDLEGIRVDEVVAEAAVEVLVGGDGGHDVGDCDGGVGGLEGRVFGVDDGEFVLVGVAEEGAADSVAEAVDDGVPQICGRGDGFIVGAAAGVDVLDDPDRLVVGFGFEQVVDHDAEHACLVGDVGLYEGIYIEVIPDITV